MVKKNGKLTFYEIAKFCERYCNASRNYVRTANVTVTQGEIKQIRRTLF